MVATPRHFRFDHAAVLSALRARAARLEGAGCAAVHGVPATSPPGHSAATTRWHIGSLGGEGRPSEPWAVTWRAAAGAVALDEEATAQAGRRTAR